MFKTRKEQVYGETISSIPIKQNYPTSFHIQLHEAQKAGRHYDFRLIIDGKAYSWAAKYLLPKTTKERSIITRQPDHKPEYATWSGKISAGEYGAGKVSLIYSGNVVVVKSSPTNIKIAFDDGEYEGVYSFLHKGGNDWLVVRNREFAEDWYAKDKYKTKIKDEMWTDPNVIASEKKDGASVVAKITAGRGINIVSVRKSKRTSKAIRKNNQVPHLAYIKAPKEYDGMVFRGELYMDKYPFSVVSGVLNSKPRRAIEAQDRLGEKIKLAPFEIMKLPGGKDPSGMNYVERLKLLESLQKALGSKDISMPNHTTKDKKAFHDNIIATGGEGTVLRHVDSNQFYKVKKHMEYTLRIVDYTEGTGKFKGTGIGAFIVEDGKKRRVGQVGTGLTDQMRIDAYKNFSKYKGKLIKVKMHEPTLKSIRAPVFKGFSTDKNEPDVLPF